MLSANDQLHDTVTWCNAKKNIRMWGTYIQSDEGGTVAKWVGRVGWKMWQVQPLSRINGSDRQGTLASIYSHSQQQCLLKYNAMTSYVAVAIFGIWKLPSHVKKKCQCKEDTNTCPQIEVQFFFNKCKARLSENIQLEYFQFIISSFDALSGVSF